MIEVNKENFENEVLGASGVVMVDLWGPKCERCLELMPHVEELAHKYQDQIKFCSSRYLRKPAPGHKPESIRSAAILFYKDGQKIDELSGQEIAPEDIEINKQYAK